MSGLGDGNYRLYDDNYDLIHVGKSNPVKRFRYSVIFAICTFVAMISISIVFGISNRISNDKIDKMESEMKLKSDSIRNLEYSLEIVETEYNVCSLNSMVGEILISGKHVKISEKALYEYIVECGAWYPEIVAAQAILESSDKKGKRFSSNVYKENRNLFGMTKVGTRKNVQNSKDCEDDRFGYYDDWRLSVIDRILWDYEVFGDIKPSKEEYLAKLNSIYAKSNGKPTIGYVKKLVSMSKKFEKYKNKVK